MAYTVILNGGYSISDDRARLDMEFIHRVLAVAYRAAGRPRALNERS